MGGALGLMGGGGFEIDGGGALGLMGGGFGTVGGGGGALGLMGGGLWD